MTNGSPGSIIPNKNILMENRKKKYLKEKIINRDKKISLVENKKNNDLTKNVEENKNFGNEEKNENNNDKNINIDMNDKGEEKNCVYQLNLIKENLEDNLKNMFNFSYGYYLNYERESDSSKSLYKLNNDFSNFKIN